jgi:hypothetical protein
VAIHFEVKKKVLARKKITFNGKEYESLDEVPAEARGAIESALQSGTPVRSEITFDGKTYASVEEMPAPLRTVVRLLESAALKDGDAEAGAAPEAAEPGVSIGGAEPGMEMGGAVRPEPIVSARTFVIALGLAALAFWMSRLIR